MKAACIQLNSGGNVNKNLQDCADLIREAAGYGASFIATPENTDLVVSNRLEKLELLFGEDIHPGIPFFADLAKELGVTLLIGSMGIQVNKDKIANRSFLFSPEGELMTTYDKIHLYDVDLPSGESHRESRVFSPGDKAVVVDGDNFKLGMSICYDLRFPHLYRDLAKAGAEILTIPAAFTVPTGKAHWHILLRARAVETGSFILAPAQSGDHDGARSTFGHSLIIGPWGDILAECSESGPGFIMADLKLEDVDKAREAIPALKHDREYDIITASLRVR